jgi:plastocyanin
LCAEYFGVLAISGPEVHAAGGACVFFGLLVAALWTAQVWREHPSWTPRLGDRMGQRLLVPSLLPIVALLTTAVIAISISRILLAVSKDGSIMIAGAAALVILLACAVVATRPRVGPGAMLALIAVAALFAGTAGVVGAAAGEREFHPHHEGEHKVEVVAKDTAFETKKIEVEAGHTVVVDFHNEDPILHNFAVYTPGADNTSVGEAVFAGRPVVEREVVLEMKIPKPGNYVFVCDFHASMRGDLVAQ